MPASVTAPVVTTTPVTSADGGASLDAAIAKFQAASDTAAAKSINTTTRITEIKGDDDAIKKIN